MDCPRVMLIGLLGLLVFGASALAALPSTKSAEAPAHQSFLAWAPTPPMGWNSWDCFGAGVNEAVRVHDLWKRQDVGTAQERFEPMVPPHGAGLYRLSPLG